MGTATKGIPTISKTIHGAPKQEDPHPTDQERWPLTTHNNDNTSAHATATQGILETNYQIAKHYVRKTLFMFRCDIFLLIPHGA